MAVAVASALAVAAAACGSPPPAAAPHSGGPRVIIDTDLSLYWDDVTAVGMANVLQQQGMVQILGIMSDIRNPVAAEAIDAIDTAYGHAGIPVGAVAGTDADTAPHGYSDVLADRLPHRTTADSAHAAVPLYRRLLAAQPDDSATVVAIGAYTNLAGLLRSPPGQGSPLGGLALVAAKVRRLVVEDGLFPSGGPPLTNTTLDVASARTVVADWPTPIAWVDGSTGIATRVGSQLCTATPPTDPMHIVYQRLFGCGPPGDGDWDGPTLLYAVSATPRAFVVLGRGGTAVMSPTGSLTWRSDSVRPDDVYVHVADQRALNERIDQLLDDP